MTDTKLTEDLHRARGHREGGLEEQARLAGEGATFDRAPPSGT